MWVLNFHDLVYRTNIDLTAMLDITVWLSAAAFQNDKNIRFKIFC